MSNQFWLALAAVGGAYWLFGRPKAAASSAPAGASPPSLVPAPGGGSSAYGQFPGLSEGGAAGVVTDPYSGPSGTLDNSRVFDPGAQAQATVWSAIDPATGLPYPDRSMQLDGGGTGEWTEGDGYQFRQVNE